MTNYLSKVGPPPSNSITLEVKASTQKVGEQRYSVYKAWAVQEHLLSPSTLLPLLLIQKISSVLCVPDSLVYAADNTRDRKEVAFMSVDLLLSRFSSRKTSLLNPLFPDLPLADSPLYPFLKRFIYLTALGLCCCAWAFSSCGEQGLLSSCDVWASHHSGFSCCRAQALELPG